MTKDYKPYPERKVLAPPRMKTNIPAERIRAAVCSVVTARRPTVELERLPERHERMAVEQEAMNECECAEATDALCKPCGCREALNMMRERAEEL